MKVTTYIYKKLKEGKRISAGDVANFPQIQTNRGF
jgi:hypothetical protein